MIIMIFIKYIDDVYYYKSLDVKRSEVLKQIEPPSSIYLAKYAPSAPRTRSHWGELRWKTVGHG
jgi:hypothetical protein